MVNDDGVFMTYQEFSNRYGQTFNFIEYGRIIKVIKDKIKTCTFKQENFKLQSDFQILPLELVNKNNKGCKEFYKVLISNETKPTSCQRWTTDLNLAASFKWKKVYLRPFSITKDSNLIWLQIRIVHKILGTNSLLSKMKIVQSDLCSFCNSSEETILHLFWDCPLVEKFWLDVIRFLKSNHFVHNDLEMNAQLIIFGGKNIPDVVNLIMLIAKRYIYS